MTSFEKQPKIAAIIAAYNEAEYLGRVLGVLRQVDVLNEILVINDGSQDATEIVALQATERDERIRLLRHPTNRGKGQAIYTGRENTRAGILLLLDADLLELKPSQVRSLIQPVLKGEADMTLGLFRGGRLNTDLAHWATPWLSGQRCLRNELLDMVSRPAAQGYGLETAITVAALLNGWKTQPVWLEGVYHPDGETHRGFVRGLFNRVSMYAQIIRAWYVAGGLQSLDMLYRRNRTRVKKPVIDRTYQ
jgi:glycosyltransferase involved in cell wall biosynthesis